MDNGNTTRPLDPAERTAVAGLLYTVSSALTADIKPERASMLAGFIVHALTRAETDVRRGHRAHDIKATTVELSDRVEQLATGDVVT